MVAIIYISLIVWMLKENISVLLFVVSGCLRYMFTKNNTSLTCLMRSGYGTSDFTVPIDVAIGKHAVFIGRTVLTGSRNIIGLSRLHCSARHIALTASLALSCAGRVNPDYVKEIIQKIRLKNFS